MPLMLLYELYFDNAQKKTNDSRLFEKDWGYFRILRKLLQKTRKKFDQNPNRGNHQNNFTTILENFSANVTVYLIIFGPISCLETISFNFCTSVVGVLQVSINSGVCMVA